LRRFFWGEGRRVVRGVNIMFHKTKLVLSQFAGKIKLGFHVSWQKRPLFDPNAHNLWLEKFICPKHSFDVFIICPLPVLCGAKTPLGCLVSLGMVCWIDKIHNRQKSIEINKLYRKFIKDTLWVIYNIIYFLLNYSYRFYWVINIVITKRLKLLWGS